MSPFGIQQRFCRRTFLRTSNVSDDCPQPGIPTGLIGMEQSLCRRAFFRISEVGCGAQLGAPTRLIGIRRSICAAAVFRISDIGEHPPPAVPVMPIEHTDHALLQVIR
jgi:hypothetical protein